MQIKLTLRPLGSPTLPLNYNYAVQGCIYSLLSSEPSYAGFLHNVGYVTSGGAFRMFTFGGITGDYRIENKLVIPTGHISFEIRSVSEQFCEILKNSLLSAEKLSLMHGEYALRMIEVYDRHIEDGEVDIITASPVVARITANDGSSVYYSPDDERFAASLNATFIKKVEALCGVTPDYGISVMPYGKTRKIVTRFKGTWVTAYHGKFRITGDPESLDLLYQTGLGSRCSQGFGMFDVLQ